MSNVLDDLHFNPDRLFVVFQSIYLALAEARTNKKATMKIAKQYGSRHGISEEEVECVAGMEIQHVWNWVARGTS